MKQKSCIFGIFISVIIVIFGILVLLGVFTKSIGSLYGYKLGYAEFGGDAYTYMNNNVAEAANVARGINTASGIFLIGFGLLGVCLFNYLMDKSKEEELNRRISQQILSCLQQFEKDNKRERTLVNNKEQPTKTTETVASLNAEEPIKLIKQEKQVISTKPVEQVKDKQTESNEAEKAINPTEITDSGIQNSKPTKKPAKLLIDQNTLPDVAAYALRYTTDDGMISYLKGQKERLSIDDSTTIENLLNLPESQIRSELNTLVEKNK